MRRLEGKHAIVTGAGAGIGRAIALRMAEEGARVVVADVNEEGAEKVAAELEGDSLVQQADVTKEEEVEALVRRIVEEWGGLHVMINNCRDRDRRDYSGDHRTLGQGLGCVLEGNVLRDEVRNTGHKGFGGWINNKYVLHRRTDRHQGSGGLQRCEGRDPLAHTGGGDRSHRRGGASQLHRPRHGGHTLDCPHHGWVQRPQRSAPR